MYRSSMATTCRGVRESTATGRGESSIWMVVGVMVAAAGAAAGTAVNAVVLVVWMRRVAAAAAAVVVVSSFRSEVTWNDGERRC